MAQSQVERNRKSMEKLGIVQKKFNFDADTAALLERMAAHTGKPQVQVLKAALALYAAQAGLE